MDNAEYPGAVCPYDVDWASPTRPAHPGRDVFAGARGILCQNIAQTATRTSDTGIPHRPCAIHVMQDTVCTGQFIIQRRAGSTICGFKYRPCLAAYQSVGR